MALTATATTPPSIQLAVRCLFIAALLCGLMTILQLSGLVPSAGGAGFTLFVGVFTAGGLLLVANRTAARRNWARWLFLTVYVLGAGLFLLSLLLMPQAFLSQPLLLRASALVQTLLQTAALFGMFSRSSHQWLVDRSATATS